MLAKSFLAATEGCKNKHNKMERLDQLTGKSIKRFRKAGTL